MAKDKHKSLADAIKTSLITDNVHAPWHLRLDADVLSELKQLRSEWQEGKIPAGCKTLAIAISKRLRDEKLSTIGFHGVVAWLKKKD